MPKSKKPSDQRLREPLPSLDDDVENSPSEQVETSTNQQSDSSVSRVVGTSSQQDVDTSTSRQNEKSTQQTEDKAADGGSTDASREAKAKGNAAPSRLRQQLQVLMEDVDLPVDAPRMTEKTNAHISDDADQRLREAVRVLEMRYGKGFSKSLLVEYILREALWDLYENADDSQIVRILDRVFEP